MTTPANDYLYQGLDFSLPVKRREVRAQSDTSIYAAGSKWTISFPQNWADFRQSYLTFDAIATRTGGTYIRFSYPITSIFTYVQVKLGGELVEYIDNWQVLQGIFQLASDINSVTNVFDYGVYSSAATRAAEAVAGRTYNVALRLESLLRVIPLHKINQPLQLILQVAPSSTFMETDGAVNTLQFSNVYYNHHIIDGTAQQAADLDASIAAGKCLILFHSYENYNTSVATATNQTMSLPVRRKNVNGILGVARLQSVVNNLASDGKFTDSYNLSNVPTIAYAKINGQPVPNDQYQMTGLGLGYYQLSKAFNALMNDDFYAHFRQGSTFSKAAQAARLVYAFDLRQDSSPSSSGKWNNGTSTADSSNSALVSITYAGASGAAVYDFFSRYEGVIRVAPGLSATITS